MAKRKVESTMKTTKEKKQNSLVLNSDFINEDYVIKGISRRELSISMNYVEDWGIVEAIREVFQNGLDAESKNSKNKMSFKYNKVTKHITIANKKGILEESSLLLGASSKRDDDKQIGKFGEGYKVASVVLLRTGHTLIIYNHSKKQIWNIRKSKSRLYKTNIVVADIYTIDNWTKEPENNLAFDIGEITEEEYAEVVKSNLVLQEKEGNLGKIYETPYGRLLCDEKYKGKVFVSGLYVTKDNALDKGYDFKPKYIKLDRDRGLITDFNLKDATAKILGSIKDTSLVAEMIDKKDAHFYQYEATESNKSQVSDIVATKFKQEYGTKSYPVTDQTEADRAKDKGFDPIIVSSTRKSLITNSGLFKPEAEKVTTIAPLINRVEKFFNAIRYKISDSDVSEMKSLLKELKVALNPKTEDTVVEDYNSLIYSALDEENNAENNKDNEDILNLSDFSQEEITNLAKGLSKLGTTDNGIPTMAECEKTVKDIDNAINELKESDSDSPFLNKAKLGVESMSYTLTELGKLLDDVPSSMLLQVISKRKKVKSKTRYAVQGVGGVNSSTYLLYYTQDEKFVAKVKELDHITFGDGTQIRLSVREMEYRERKLPEKKGYLEQVRLCIKYNTSSIDDAYAQKDAKRDKK